MRGEPRVAGERKPVGVPELGKGNPDLTFKATVGVPTVCSIGDGNKPGVSEGHFLVLRLRPERLVAR